MLYAGNKPLISVIIPLFNAENTIVKTLDSIRKQTYPCDKFEIIIINDGSTDQSKSKAEGFIQQNSDLNIQLFDQINQGVSAARNAGLRVATGEFIAFLDSDDVWLPEKIERQMEFFENEKLDIDFLVTLRNNESAGFPYQNNRNVLAEITFRKLLIRITGQTSTALMRRKVVENVGLFDEKQRYSEDANYWFRISEHHKMYLLQENLVITGGGKRSFGSSGLSANLPEMEKGIQKNLKELRSSGRLNGIAYLFYYTFTKMKYIIRLIRVKNDL